MIDDVSFFLDLVSIVIILGTLLSLGHNPHWFARLWDFPRFHILGLTIFVVLLKLGFSHPKTVFDFIILVILAIISVWHLISILPYTIFFPKKVKDAADRKTDETSDVRIVISNLQMENEKYDLWKKIILKEDPDLILIVEINKQWQERLESLNQVYPYRFGQTQENCYGMMLYSRFKLSEMCIKNLVQDDVPSIHTTVHLSNGEIFKFHGIHPRPPEPIRNQDSAPRDAELVILGRELIDKSTPQVVSGDLNDVAWSKTTRLFLRTSGLLDPRIGRGFFNSFNAKSYFVRFPLDHLFHSHHFLLKNLVVLNYVGSDHFPILVDLCLDPSAPLIQEKSQEKNGDQEKQKELLDNAKESSSKTSEMDK